MSSKTDTSSAPTLIEHLEKDLAAAEAKEQSALLQVEDAKSLLSAAKDESKRLRKIIELYSGKPSSSLTKNSIRPIIERLLRDGDSLPESDIREGVEAELREKSVARTGLSLILRVLKKEFASDGVWSMATALNGQSENGESTAVLGGAKGGAK